MLFLSEIVLFCLSITKVIGTLKKVGTTANFVEDARREIYVWIRLIVLVNDELHQINVIKRHSKTYITLVDDKI